MNLFSMAVNGPTCERGPGPGFTDLHANNMLWDMRVNIRKSPLQSAAMLNSTCV